MILLAFIGILAFICTVIHVTTPGNITLPQRVKKYDGDDNW